MPQTPREIMTRCLTFEHPERMPRDTWTLPWAHTHHPGNCEKLQQKYPNDMSGPPNVYRPSPRVRGNAYEQGTHVDEWGCRFENIQAGLIGEVKEPLIADIADWDQLEPPCETLPDDTDKARDIVNRACAESDRFMRANCNPRPWERMQFIRGTVNAMMDIMDPDGGARNLIGKIHDFHLQELEFWVTTDVDAISFMDDWGSQQQLLIKPELWRELFKPLYRDYCDIAHAHDKFAMMHSDGHIQTIYPDLIEVGVDAINSQLFCMDMAALARTAKGKITFWGEIDRQHVMNAADTRVGRNAVREVAEHLYSPAGGIIAQFEYGAGANPDMPFAIYDEWDQVQADAAVSA